MKHMESKIPRVLVDPRVQEAEAAFQQMMVRFKAKTREEHIRDGIARGVLDADGKPIPPEGDPCVSRV